MSISVIVQAIIAAISAAPQIEELVVKTKEWVTALFTSKVITAEQQAALHQHVDSVAAMAKAGMWPSHWTIEPDPK